jgi:hypothetical protein
MKQQTSALLRYAPLVAFVLRVVLALVVMMNFLAGERLRALFFGGVFVVLFVFSRVGKRNPWYAVIDGVLLAFFVLTWTVPGLEMESSVFGIDKLFHTAGGLLLGFVGIALYRAWIADDAALAITAVVFALAVGAGWEFFEWMFYSVDPRFMPTTYDDSMLDLVADTLGATIAALAWLWSRRN